ncbi:unnamed protein product [Larinioides sclopetarius]|uniref:Vesicle-fusing ATPase n=1 Tax=Larinioides sclopetarius TaxID=280406 RepID=A0AAV1Z987_9ARAC
MDFMSRLRKKTYISYTLKRGKELGNEAVEEDKKENYEAACRLYLSAAEAMNHAIRYEELNETTFQRMRERADAYLERSEELKKYLAAEHMKRNVTDISGESPRKEDFKEDEEEEEEEKEEEEEEEEYSSDLQQRLDIVQKPYVKWCDVFGLREAKQILGEAFIMPLKFPHLFTGKRKPWKSILLYGPPGTGKTLLVQALASSVPSSTFIFLSNYLDESDSFLKDLFKNKRAQSPKLILVDEIDAVFNLESTRGMRMELFTYHMEGRDCSDGILILATTNKPWLLNEPLLKRFEKKIYTSFPNWTDRLQILKFCLGDAPHCLTEKNLEELATKTEGYSGDDISAFVRDALMQSIRKVNAATHYKRSDMLLSLARSKPTTTEYGLRRYEYFQKYSC